MSKRVTKHSARKGKNGVFGNGQNSHDDRNFDITKADHIDAKKVKLNHIVLIDWNGGCHRNNKSIMAHQKSVYEKHFRPYLDDYNQRQKDQRHSERCKDISDYMASSKSCVEKEIFQIGTNEDFVDGNTLEEIWRDFLEWHVEKYPQCHFLNYAVHFDETNCADHIHTDKVWVAHDEYGREFINQNKALEEMGVERPNPEKPSSRYNNAKMTYTKDCREKILELCRDRKMDLILDPKNKSEVGLVFAEYKRLKEEKQIKALKAEKEVLKAEIEPLREEITALNATRKEFRQFKEMCIRYKRDNADFPDNEKALGIAMQILIENGLAEEFEKRYQKTMSFEKTIDSFMEELDFDI